MAIGGAEVIGFDILKSICKMGIKAANETSEKTITNKLRTIFITA
jgi:hypothetical protein